MWKTLDRTALASAGWIGNAFLVVGLVAIGELWPPAFLFTLIGESLWLWKCWRMRAWDMVFICATFAGLAAWNWVKWNM